VSKEAQVYKAQLRKSQPSPHQAQERIQFYTRESHRKGTGSNKKSELEIQEEMEGGFFLSTEIPLLRLLLWSAHIPELISTG
jgi:hypothetical protein